MDLDGAHTSIAKKAFEFIVENVRQKQVYDVHLTVQEKIDLDLDAVQSVLETFQEIADVQMAQIRRQRNQLLPVATLPVETLVKVFDYYLDLGTTTNGEDHRPSMVATICGICSAWNGIVQHTPQLWSRINTGYPPTFIRKALEKSRGHSIAMSGSLGNGVDTVDSQEAIFNACGQLSRWASASLTTVSSENLDILTYSAAPALKTLEIDCDDEEAPPLNLFNGEAPQLQHLRLTNVTLVWTSPILTGLRTLSLHAVVGPEPTQFFRILQACPSLRSLFLKFFWFTADATPDPAEVPVLELLELEELNGSNISIKVVQQITSRLRCPKATNINLTLDTSIPSLSRGDAAASVQPIVPFAIDFLGRRSPADTLRVGVWAQALSFTFGRKDKRREMRLLGSPLGVEVVMEQLEGRFEFPPLSLRLAGWDRSHLWRRLHSLPSTVELKAYKESPDVASYLGEPVEEDGVLRWPLPKLSEVTLGKRSCADAEEILQMVRSRKGRPRPTSAAPMELPVPLAAMTIRKGCPMDRVTFMKLKAILPEAKLVWEGSRD